jgi:hypothetical protein
LAQVIHSQFTADGRFRIHAIEGLGRRKPRVVEIEVVDTGERVHGSARWLGKLAKELQAPTTMSSEWTSNSLAYLRSSKGKRI